MSALTHAIRTTGRVDKSNNLLITELPLDVDTPVEIIIIPDLHPDEEFSELEWLGAAARNPVFADWADPEEDIYSPDEGKPFDEFQ
jgi:hypothetical protein